MMFWFVIGYMFLFIFRPFEYWPVLGEYHIERIYMLCLMTSVFLWREKRYIPHPINKAVLLFFAIMLISAATAFDQNAAFTEVFDYFKLIVFYFIVALTIRDERELKNFIFAFLIIMFLYVGKSAWEFFIHDRYVYRMGIKRMTGVDITYGDPNAFAASIVYSLPFLWAMIKCQLENRWIKIMLWAYGILAPVCILYTGSRSGMVTSLLFFVLIWFYTSKKLLGLVLLSLLLMVTWVNMPESYKIRFESIFVHGIAEKAGQKGADDSARGRIEGLKMGIKTFKSYPLLGIGPANFKYAWAGATGEVIGWSAHNLYGQLLGELGGLGFISFSILVGLILKTHYGVKKEVSLFLQKKKDEITNDEARDLLLLQYISIASIQAIILLLFNGNFGHNLYRYLWLWIGAIGVLSTQFISEMKCFLDKDVAGLKSK